MPSFLRSLPGCTYRDTSLAVPALLQIQIAGESRKGGAQYNPPGDTPSGLPANRKYDAAPRPGPDSMQRKTTPPLLIPQNPELRYAGFRATRARNSNPLIERRHAVWKNARRHGAAALR